MVKQVIISKYGGPEVLKIQEVALPQPGPGQIRIRIRATGVAFADVLMREGLYPQAPRLPFVPGFDVAGEVDAIAQGVSGLTVGQRVLAVIQFGGYQSAVTVDASLAVPIPDSVDDVQAIPLGLNYLTAYQMLYRMARVYAGDRILVHGAAGGVGTALLELATLMKLDAWGTASRSKHPIIEGYGAVPIDYKTQDFVQVVRQQTGDGVDAVFDAIGGKHWQKSLRTLRPGGRLVAYGFSAAVSNGRKNIISALLGFIQSPRLSPLDMLFPNIGIMGYTISTLQDQRPDWYRKDLLTLLDLCAQGKLKPVISEVLPLTRAVDAHRLISQSKVIGKIVLVNE
ncbi:MAG TPA: medium chain dehydrogenase/reductase family protein [Nostocaceae cyanobacterium]|nr:medium chain dehydrogenase/reductase family protein [Nostocaceae cyanobacterium]